MTYLIIALVLLLLIVPIWAFNSLRKADQGVKKDWNNITTELQRRHELIPNLVATVQKYAAHESTVLQEVTEARLKASVPPKDPQHAADVAAAQDLVSASVGRLLAVAENYPDLKASDNYRQLQAELTDTEDRIAASRKLYNSSVEHLNNKTRTFPSMFFVSMAGVTTAEYYTVSEERRREFEQSPDVRDLFS